MRFAVDTLIKQRPFQINFVHILVFWISLGQTGTIDATSHYADNFFALQASIFLFILLTMLSSLSKSRFGLKTFFVTVHTIIFHVSSTYLSSIYFRLKEGGLGLWNGFHVPKRSSFFVFGPIMFSLKPHHLGITFSHAYTRP